MTRYHLNENGEPAPCKATKQPCPLGASPHHEFNNIRDAQLWAEFRNDLEHKGLGSLSDDEGNMYESFEENSDYWIDDDDESWDFYSYDFGRESVKAFARRDNNLAEVFLDAKERLEADDSILDIEEGETISALNQELWSSWAADQINKNPDKVTVFDLVSGGDAEPLFRNRSEVIARGELTDEATETILSRRYDDSRFAEPSNILRVLKGDKSLFIQNVESSFPIDGAESSDVLTFDGEWGKYTINSKKNTVNVLFTPEDEKPYYLCARDVRDGFDLQERLKKIISWGEGIGDQEYDGWVYRDVDYFG